MIARKKSSSWRKVLKDPLGEGIFFHVPPGDVPERKETDREKRVLADRCRLADGNGRGMRLVTITGMEAGRETLAVYAIVNSLTSLDGIDKVQFSINGETNVTLGLSKLSLAEPFAFNIDIVEIKE